MKIRAVGVWGTAHWTLDLIGRGAVRFIPTKTSWSQVDAYSVTGGAVVGTVFGALLSFTWSDESHASAIPAGVAIGSLLGLCIGVMFGAVVQTVDEAIDDWLNSLNSK